jgi:hypothetical protein
LPGTKEKMGSHHYSGFLLFTSLSKDTELALRRLKRKRMYSKRKLTRSWYNFKRKVIIVIKERERGKRSVGPLLYLKFSCFVNLWYLYVLGQQQQLLLHCT